MWDIQITLDAGRTDIGTITGVWTEDADTFTFSERSAVDEAGQKTFMEHAVAARDAWQEQRGRAKEASDALTNSMNTTDKQAVAIAAKLKGVQ
jgi:hypothetical protein